MTLVEVDQWMLYRLRALRLYHWKERGRYRNAARIYSNGYSERNHRMAEYSDQRADFHLSQVQTLNDFFPLGDTAENDEAKNEKG